MKYLKLWMIVILLVPALVNRSDAQNKKSGLYLTYNDYRDHHLSYSTPAESPGENKIYLHQFMEGSTITVITNGKKLVLPKDNVFGYRDPDGRDFRFYQNKAFLVVDTAGFYIYSYMKLAQQGKGYKPATVYYFSKKEDSAVMPLNAENIAAAFSHNHKFKNMVELEERSDARLDAYDNSAKEFKIKELYEESLR